MRAQERGPPRRGSSGLQPPSKGPVGRRGRPLTEPPTLDAIPVLDEATLAPGGVADPSRGDRLGTLVALAAEERSAR